LTHYPLESGIIIHFGKTIPEEGANIIATGPILGEIPAIAKGIAFKTNIKDVAIALFSNKVAYKAYSYLLVTKGYGCMCSVVFGDMRRINNCFKETRKIYSEMLNLDIKEPKNVGGIGSFSLESIFENDKALIVGEAAGLQDFLWGFGMRYAITSGYLAAKSIIDNGDYKEIAEKHFSHRLKASAVNRYLWEKFGESEYSFLLENVEFIESVLGSMHNFNLVQRILYPIALSYLRKRYSQLRL